MSCIFLLELCCLSSEILIEFVIICTKYLDEYKNPAFGYGCQLNANNYNGGYAFNRLIVQMMKVSGGEVQLHMYSSQILGVIRRQPG